MFIFKITHKNTYFILEFMLHIWFYILLCHLKAHCEYFHEPIKFIESITWWLQNHSYSVILLSFYCWVFSLFPNLLSHKLGNQCILISRIFLYYNKGEHFKSYWMWRGRFFWTEEPYTGGLVLLQNHLWHAVAAVFSTSHCSAFNSASF